MCCGGHPRHGPWAVSAARGRRSDSMVRRLGKHFQVLVRWSERMLRLVAIPAGPVSTLKLQRAFAAEAGMIRRAPPKKECGVAAGTRSAGSIGVLYTDFPPRIRGCRQCAMGHNVRDYPGHCWPLRTEVGDFVGARYRLGAKSDLMCEKQMARRHRPRWQGFARHHGVGACVAMLASHVFSIFWPFLINPL